MTLAELKAYYIDLREELEMCKDKYDYMRGATIAGIKRTVQQKIERIEEKVFAGRNSK